MSIVVVVLILTRTIKSVVTGQAPPPPPPPYPTPPHLIALIPTVSPGTPRDASSLSELQASPSPSTPRRLDRSKSSRPSRRRWMVSPQLSSLIITERMRSWAFRRGAPYLPWGGFCVGVVMLVRGVMVLGKFEGEGFAYVDRQSDFGRREARKRNRPVRSFFCIRARWRGEAAPPLQCACSAHTVRLFARYIIGGDSQGCVIGRVFSHGVVSKNKQKKRLTIFAT